MTYTTGEYFFSKTHQQKNKHGLHIIADRQTELIED